VEVLLAIDERDRRIRSVDQLEVHALIP
jgi:hypothetical protein